MQHCLIAHTIWKGHPITVLLHACKHAGCRILEGGGGKVMVSGVLVQSDMLGNYGLLENWGKYWCQDRSSPLKRFLSITGRCVITYQLILQLLLLSTSWPLVHFLMWWKWGISHLFQTLASSRGSSYFLQKHWRVLPLDMGCVPQPLDAGHLWPLASTSNIDSSPLLLAERERERRSISKPGQSGRSTHGY